MDGLFLGIDSVTKEMWISLAANADVIASEIVEGTSQTQYYWIDNTGVRPVLRDITIGPAVRTTTSVDRIEIIANGRALGKTDVVV